VHSSPVRRARCVASCHSDSSPGTPVYRDNRDHCDTRIDTCACCS